ncbi:MAG TPA: LytTR family DNA-binding domain-containing protein [Lunatimonas sp.]|nr:LytTR family DNA-binding domain-containing protein [Lunatimonas sp.]
MKTIIIEDEKLAADRLNRLITKVSADVTVVATLRSVEEAVNYLQSHTPDLIFLDIHLSDGSSFEIFDQVHVTSPIIFTTAYHEYALKAFKVNSIDYLLKPIDEAALSAALDKLRQLKNESNTTPMGEIEALISMMKKQEISYRQRFLVTFGNKIKTIKSTEVAYIFAADRAVFLVDKSGNRYVIDETLDQLQNSLEPMDFFRVNRAFLVGIDSIEQMHSYSRSRIKIELNPPCPKECIVSTEKTPDFKGWLSR